MSETKIKDETLRLTLSVGQKEWLNKQIRHRHLAIVGLLVFAVLSLGVGYLDLETDMTGTPIPILLAALAPFAVLVAAMLYIDARKYKHWLAGHRDFLKHYNRWED